MAGHLVTLALTDIGMQSAKFKSQVELIRHADGHLLHEVISNPIHHVYYMQQFSLQFVAVFALETLVEQGVVLVHHHIYLFPESHCCLVKLQLLTTILISEDFQEVWTVVVVVVVGII